MIFEQRGTRGLLRGVVRRLTLERVLQEDLIQEALIHLWTRETEHPGQSRNWYIQSCRLHLQNFLRKGRSVDCGKHRHALNLQVADRENEKELELGVDETLISLVCARDLVAELSKWLTPVEKEILSLSNEGLSVREIGKRLDLSHTSVIRRRRNIAALASRLGSVALRTAGEGEAASQGKRSPSSNTNIKQPASIEVTQKGIMKRKKCQQFALAVSLVLLGSANVTSAAPGTAFTYQGRLQDGGTPAQGVYDLRFAIYDAATEGSTWGPVLTNAGVAISNGLFTATLNFGAGVFTGSPRWLEVAMRTNGSVSGFTELSPRQPLLPAPYATWAASADSVPAGNITSGTIADSRLSTNVALLNQGASFSGVLAATAFYGNGAGLTNVAGAFTWQVVTGTVQQAAARTGYLANNVAQVAITLPASPPVGDTVRVAGMGAGGWRIAQNDGQLILTKPIGGAAGLTWTPCTNAPNVYWQVIAMSADGNELLAGQIGGQLWTSTNAGATWTARETIRQWRCAASSVDGTKLVAVVQDGQIYSSTDSGVTWTPRESSRGWIGVASSDDGSKLVATVQGGQIYTSTDSGVTWTPRDSSRQWQYVASSADGTKLVTGEYGGQIYTSSDSGVTWTPRESNRRWRSFASSANGTKLAAGVVDVEQIYVSTDSGVTWTPRAVVGDWEGLASSADGSRLVAVWEGGSIYTSTDSGNTWTERAHREDWEAVRSSVDGNSLVAVAGGGPSGWIYTSVPSTTAGTSGALTGDADAAIELQYIGGGQFRILSFVGAISAQ